MAIQHGQVYISKWQSLDNLSYTGDARIIQKLGENLCVIDTSGDMDKAKIPRLRLFGEGGLYKSEEAFLEEKRLATPEEARAVIGAWQRHIRNRNELSDLVGQYIANLREGQLAQKAQESEALAQLSTDSTYLM